MIHTVHGRLGSRRITYTVVQTLLNQPELMVLDLADDVTHALLENVNADAAGPFAWQPKFDLADHAPPVPPASPTSLPAAEEGGRSC